MPLSRNLLLAILVVASVATTTPAAPPSTNLVLPVVGPSVDARHITELYRQLGAVNPVDRNSARVELMGLSLSNLPILRDAASSDQPMSPAQALALREIVIHVFTAARMPMTPAQTLTLRQIIVHTLVSTAQPLSAVQSLALRETVTHVFASLFEKETSAFLGLQSTLNGFDSIAVSDPAYPDDPTKIVYGTSFSSRKPGFCAYRYLQDGDVILSCEDVDNAPGQIIPITGFAKMMNIIVAMAPGTHIRLRVFRGGSVVPLTFPLDARPIKSVLDGLPEVMRAADEYWRENFLQLINPDFT